MVFISLQIGFMPSFVSPFIYFSLNHSWKHSSYLVFNSLQSFPMLFIRFILLKPNTKLTSKNKVAFFVSFLFLFTVSVWPERAIGSPHVVQKVTHFAPLFVTLFHIAQEHRQSDSHLLSRKKEVFFIYLENTFPKLDRFLGHEGFDYFGNFWDFLSVTHYISK